jgi:hypothetical protein
MLRAAARLSIALLVIALIARREGLHEFRRQGRILFTIYEFARYEFAWRGHGA